MFFQIFLYFLLLSLSLSVSLSLSLSLLFYYPHQNFMDANWLQIGCIVMAAFSSYIGCWLHHVHVHIIFLTYIMAANWLQSVGYWTLTFAAKRQPFCRGGAWCQPPGWHHHPWRRPVIAENLGRATISSLSYSKTSCYLTWLRITSIHELECSFFVHKTRLQVCVQNCYNSCNTAHICKYMSINWLRCFLLRHNSIKILPPD